MIKGSCLCGSATWQLDEIPASATACSCTACRRYGALWAYGYEGEDIRVGGETTPYVRGTALSFNFCPKCGCVSHWRGSKLDEQGRRRMAVNLRMAEPGPIAHVLIDHFDGLEKWDDLPSDGKCIKDVWF